VERREKKDNMAAYSLQGQGEEKQSEEKRLANTDNLLTPIFVPIHSTGASI